MALQPAVRPQPSVVVDLAPGSRRRQASLPLRLTVGALLLVGVLVAALVVGGGRPLAPTAGLPDPGAVTGWAQPVVDLLVRVLAVLTVGQLTYAALLAPVAPTGPGADADPGADAVRALRGGAASAVGWLLSEGAALVLTASSLFGVPVTGLSVQGVAGLLMGLPVGRASLWVGLLLALVILGCSVLLVGPPGGRRAVRWGAPVLLLTALSAVVVPVVLAGHSAAADDHVAAVVSLALHVVAASLWVGGLVGLLLHGRVGATGATGATGAAGSDGSDGSDGAEVVAVVRRFSALALGCVAVLALSGTAAVLLVAGAPSWSWGGEGWVRLLLLKTGLLAVLTALGWWHRRRTLPALAAGRPRGFLRLGLVEVAVMAATVAVSVALSASPAPNPAPGATASPEVAASPDVTASSDVAVPDAAAGTTGAGASAPDGVETDAGRSPPVEDMSGHDHGDLSVSVLVDADRFHVAAPVRPAQPVTVYNSSDVDATITAVDGSFDVQVPARTFITFPAPARAGEHPFVSRAGGEDVPGFADVLRVRATG